MSKLPYYVSRESTQNETRLPDLGTGDSVSADRQLYSKSANTPVPQSTKAVCSLANSGSASPLGNWNGAKTQNPPQDNVDPQPPAPVASQNTFYPGYIHIRADSNPMSLWHPDAQERENISFVSKAKTSHPMSPGSQVPSYPGYYHQLGFIPIADKTHPNTTLYWDLNAPEGEYINLTLNAKNPSPTSSISSGTEYPVCRTLIQPKPRLDIPAAKVNFFRPSSPLLSSPTSPSKRQHNTIAHEDSPAIPPLNTPTFLSKENQSFSFSPSTSPTTDNFHASTSPICPSCSTSPTSSSKRTRLRAQLASARQQRKSLDCDIARLSTALGIGDSPGFVPWDVLQRHLESQLQVVERQREGLVAQGERTEELEMEIEGLRGALGEVEWDDGDGKRRRMNEGMLMGRIVKREVLGERERVG